MVSKLPDEFFRRRPEDSSGAVPVDDPAAEHVEAPVKRSEHRATLWPIEAAAVLTLGALVVGYLVTSLPFLLLPSGGGDPRPAPSISANPAPSPSQKQGLYDGPTIAVSPVDWSSDCDGGDMGWADGRGFWSCPGDGVGQKLKFTLEPAEELVGIRLIGGNDQTVDEFEAERRIIAVRWRFSGGSWFDQGLPSDTVLTQEVGFPPVEATTVEVEILRSTEPGSDWGDAVTISQLQFLAPA